ncbi:MAG: hypothetical protein RIT27_295 [Pseudomonadota bacterium]|jgi:hypothetical protein
MKKIFGLFFIFIIGFIGLFQIAAKDVEQFCELAPKFKTWSDLEKSTIIFDLKPNDLSKYINKETTIVFHTPRSYGRHTCSVEIKNNQIIKATFNFLD